MTQPPRINGRAPHSEAGRPLIMPRVPEGRALTRADVMTAAQVSMLLGVPKSTVEDWARREMMPSRKRGRRRIFLRWEVEAWLVADD